LLNKLLPYKNHSYFLIYYILIKKTDNHYNNSNKYPDNSNVAIASLRGLFSYARSGAVQFARLEAENSVCSARLSIAPISIVPRAPTNIPSRGPDLKRSRKQETRHLEDPLAGVRYTIFRTLVQ